MVNPLMPPPPALVREQQDLRSEIAAHLSTIIAPNCGLNQPNVVADADGDRDERTSSGFFWSNGVFSPHSTNVRRTTS